MASQNKTCGGSSILSKPGLLADLFVRHKAKDVAAARRGQRQSLQWEEKTVGDKSIATAVHRDDFYSQLMHIVTESFKKKHHPDFRPMGTADLVDVCRNIVENKRKALCLRSEVDKRFWLTRAVRLKTPGETTSERQQRHDEFWPSYHAYGKASTMVQGEDQFPSRGENGTAPWATTKFKFMEEDTDESTQATESTVLPPITTPTTSTQSSPGRSARSIRLRNTVQQMHQQYNNVWDKNPAIAQSMGFLSGNGKNGSLAKKTMDPIGRDLKKMTLSSTAPVFAPARPPILHGMKPDTSRSARQAFDSELDSLLTSSVSSGFRGYLKTRLGRQKDGSLLALAPIAPDVPVVAMDRPRDQYFQVCNKSNNAPMPIPFVTGHSAALNLGGRGLLDKDLPPIATFVCETRKVQRIDLRWNVLLTDKGLAQFFEQLIAARALCSLQELSVAWCRKVGLATLGRIVQIASCSVSTDRQLFCLDLSGITFSVRSFEPLSEVIGKSPSIREVRLAQTGLGQSACAVSCLTNFMTCASLEVLDLGWNMFDTTTFIHFGKQLACAPRLTTLLIPGCSTDPSSHRDLPVEYFIEFLSDAAALTKLDISMNGVDHRGALIIEDVMHLSKKFKELNISENRLGCAGLRSVCRLVSQQECGLQYILFDNSTREGPTKEGKEDYLFNPTMPGGNYSLDLSRPYHRSFLRMLYKICERFNLQPGNAMTNIVYSQSLYQHAQKDTSSGHWVVARRGKLRFTFVMNWVFEDVTAKHNEWDFASFIENHVVPTRLDPFFAKVAPIFVIWRECFGKEAEQVAVLNALAKDFLFSYAQFSELCSWDPMMIGEVVRRMMQCLSGGQTTRYLALLHLSTVGEYIKCFKSFRNLLSFNVQNPTGHYILDLANNADHEVMRQLLLLDRWEIEVEKNLQYVDTSQFGDRSHFRNVLYQTQPLRGSIAELSLPEVDVIEFDYSSAKRPDPRATALDQETFTTILGLMQNHKLCQAQQIDVLRQIAHFFVIEALQLRALIGLFSNDRFRADVFAFCFFRVRDAYNEKVFRVRFATNDEPENLRRRLGYSTFFPFIQPEQAAFRFDFAQNDQRLAASLLVTLAEREGALNIKAATFTDVDGVVDTFPQGIPRSWNAVQKIPRGGVFHAAYNCSPEKRNFNIRKRQYSIYGHWSSNLAESDVKWWSSLSEANEDVVEFMEFLVGHFSDITTAFYKIDGPGGNGSISLQEFTDGIKSLGCKKFTGPNENKRTEAVFRYLDPGGEGTISLAEWMVLGQLWKEMMLTLSEFVKHLQRAFHQHPDFLEKSFRAVDEDGGGTISSQEWKSAVEGRLKYFGQSRTIFAFLDKDDGGSISLGEFMALSAFVPPDQDSLAELQGGQSAR